MPSVTLLEKYLIENGHVKMYSDDDCADLKPIDWAEQGIIGISKDRNERFSAIATLLQQNEFDFVFLQEVWSQEDYQMIKSKTCSVLPYSYYFHSGVIGSGCCIFSKGEIVDVNFLKYTLNGYIHKLQHGDWFGGKGVGYCKIRYRGIDFNLYNTHLHAEYNHKNDEYLTHRVTQAWEISQYINLTSSSADVSIIAGDFNATPDDISYKIVRFNSNLYDSYEERENKSNSNSFAGATSAHPRNSYTTKAELKEMPNGQRIDHVFYGFKDGANVRCLELLTPFDKISNKTLSYSDHEAVLSRLLIKKSNDELGYHSDQASRLEILRSAKYIIQRGLGHLKFTKIFFIFMAVMTAILYIVSCAVYVPYPFSIILMPFRAILILLAVFGIFMSGLLNPIEKHTFINAIKSMDIATSRISAILNDK